MCTELAAEGFIAAVPGNGAYVLPLDTALAREQVLPPGGPARTTRISSGSWTA